MGIKKLAQLIKENCKKGIHNRTLKYYNSNIIAVDASIFLYQFLISVRSSGQNLAFTGGNSPDGSVTSHLIGFFYRTIRIVEAGIIPVYVFDGAAPEEKVIELTKRSKAREIAEVKLQKAVEDKDQAAIEKFTRRQVRVEEEHVLETQRLLTLLGIPWVVGDSEAEAYAAYLCKNNLVNAVATEDMDSLCFGTNILIRNINGSSNKKVEIQEYNLKSILEELNLTMESFIDLCILLGCDYSSTIKGIGYKKAYEMIKKHKCIENILDNEKVEGKVPEDFYYKEAREIFKTLSSERLESEEIISKNYTFNVKYDEIDLEKIKMFLCNEKGFDEKRVTTGVNRLISCKKVKKQFKLDHFMTKK